MKELVKSDQNYTCDLGDNLLLRWSSAADTERLTELYGAVFRERADEPNPFVQHLTRELMNGHPLITAGDFAVIEQRTTGVIVAATCLMRQQWAYEEICFDVGRPEIVATLPAFRNKGLVRAIFALIHARSEARGDLAQGITGIPYYYRQFGYEFALDLGGDKRVPFANIPKLSEGETEPFVLRDADEADLPLIQRLYERERRRSHGGAPLLVTTPIDEAYWRYALANPKRESGEGFILKVLANTAGRGVGYALVHPTRWDAAIGLRGVMVDEGISLMAGLPSLLRGLPPLGAALIQRRPNMPPASKVQLGLGRAHPVYEALGDLVLGEDKPYAWYVRVADLPALLRLIAPVLERRLVESYAAGYTGELRLHFYRDGLRLLFDHGKLASVEPWQPDHNWGPRAQATFPPLVFLQLLFGHRSLAELREFLPDVWAQDEAKKLLGILFPRRVSWVLSLE